MSLLGSMTTAVSGLNAQSHALSNIAGNVANSQTTGFKRLDTSFEDLVAQSAHLDQVSGGVSAQNKATTNIQGSVEQVEDPLSLALGGRGFFSVAKPVARAPGGLVAFDARPTYTRAGDFSLDRDGYLVNGSGYALRGWVPDANGALDRSTLSEIRIDRSASAPQPTTTVSLSAKLPAAPTTPGGNPSTTMTIYDALGIQRQIQLNWSQPDADGDGAADPDTWRLTVAAPGATAPALGTIDLRFGPTASGNTVQAGTLGSFGNATGSLVGSTFATNGAATVTASLDFGQGAQPITLDLGVFGGTGGVTQTGTTEYQLQTISQDGAPAGAYSSLAFRENGDVVVNYDNGENRVVARVPVVSFANPDALERMDGQAFAATADAGLASVTDAGRGGAADINVGAVERSNVDIAAEFSKLIVAQRAYTANTRVVTTADDMLQETINMRR